MGVCKTIYDVRMLDALCMMM